MCKEKSESISVKRLCFFKVLNRNFSQNILSCSSKNNFCIYLEMEKMGFSFITRSVFCFRKYRGCCGPRGVTVSMSIQVFLLLTRCQPTTFPLKHRASSKYTFLDWGYLVGTLSLCSYVLPNILPWNGISISVVRTIARFGLIRKKAGLCP